MKVYVVLRKIDDEYIYDYCGVSATLDGAKEIIQDILDEQYEDEDEQLSSFAQYDYSTYWVYVIDGMLFEIWEEVI